MENDFVVVRKHPQMMLYVDSMQRKNATQLSFYPLERLERDSHLGRIFVATLNGSPCGYCYIGALATETRIHQACIQYDARRRLYGAAIVAHIEACAAKSGSFATRLRCGFDLEANEFWKSMGYKCIRTERGGLRRMRTINVWRKVLLPELFSGRKSKPGRMVEIPTKPASTKSTRRQNNSRCPSFRTGDKPCQ